MARRGTRVIATFRAKRGREVELEEVLRELIAPTREEDGCRLYELWRSREDGSELTFVEEWSSDEALQAHARSEHIARARERYPELIENEVELQLYDLVS